MKNYALCLFALFVLSGCGPTVKQIGKVNMISNRNIDPKQSYEVISTYTGGSKRDVKQSRSTTLEDAIDQTVRKVPGGEFLTNTKIYLIDGRYLAVEGDVFGIKSNIGFRGFKIGDKVTWKIGGKFPTGVITALKDDKTCLIKTDLGNTIERSYDDITKAE